VEYKKVKTLSARIFNKSLESNITYEIMGYLLKNPEAAGTLNAITEWWLLEQKIIYEMCRVKEALDELVENGFVLKLKGADSGVYYRINKEKEAEIKDLIEGIKGNE